MNSKPYSQEWFEDGQIDEVVFCENFLQRMPLKCINGIFFSYDGMLPDSEVEKEIYRMVKSVLTKGISKKVKNQKNCPYSNRAAYIWQGVPLLWVYVPPTSTVEKCANRIYDRNEDGDMDITDSPIQLQNMYNRKSNTYAEHKIFPYVTTEDLRMDLMDKVRNLAKSKNPDHPWLKMSDEEILKSAGLQIPAHLSTVSDKN